MHTGFQLQTQLYLNRKQMFCVPLPVLINLVGIGIVVSRGSDPVPFPYFCFCLDVFMFTAQLSFVLVFFWHLCLIFLPSLIKFCEAVLASSCPSDTSLLFTPCLIFIAFHWFFIRILGKIGSNYAGGSTCRIVHVLTSCRSMCSENISKKQLL